MKDASEPQALPATAKQGVVLRSTAGFFDILLGSGDIVRARLRGRLKRVRQNTDLCVIGDQVVVVESRDGGFSVEEVLPRRTVFSRQHPARGGHREDVLIANLDVLVIVMAYEAPPFVPRMIDRFLVIAEHNGVDAILVANKFDLRIEEDDYIDDALSLYESLGYRCVRTCATPVAPGEAEEDPGVLTLRELLAGRVSAFSGPSGAGKSSLVNRIEPGLDLRVGATSEAHGKGRHTTRVATLHPLTGGGFIADTPGIRELASFEIPAPQLAACFREFRPFLGQCTYRSCKHLTEPGCAILAAVESEDIDSDRYESFAKLLLGEERPDRVG
ncbi:MAG: ribosome small subunit-dependent GTPase A [Myxococcales bacterium]|nr:ribosome small subunit-dependent GTPase A [Myxococcales bacterium]MCB9628826.1 ribosome small subunit-dependent GTPase A [Sandaracinaceae bacterium]